MLQTFGRWFTLEWSSAEDWTLHVEDTTISPSYGLLVPTRRLVWRRNGTLAPLTVRAYPSDLSVPESWDIAPPERIPLSAGFGGEA